MLQLDAIYKAAHVLKEVVRRTDLIYAPQINPESTVYLKPENSTADHYDYRRKEEREQ